MPWSLLPVVAGALVAAVLAVPVGMLSAHRPPGPGRGLRMGLRRSWDLRTGLGLRAGRRVGLGQGSGVSRLVFRPSRRGAVIGAVAAGGLVLGGALALRRLLRALAAPTGVSQSFDAVFHLNAVRWVLERGDASSLTLGAMTTPERSAAFYPAGWHAVVTLAAGVTGAPPDVATNAAAVVVAVVVWPLSAVALVRALAGRRPVALAAAGALPAAFLAHPLLPLEWGVLYPTMLAHALLPGVLATLVAACDRARPPGARLALLVVTAAALPGLALAQPSGVFALAAITLPLGVAVLLRWGRGQWRRGGRLAVRGEGAGRLGGPVGGRVSVLAVAAGSAVVVALAWALVDRSGFASSMRHTDWLAQATVPQALWQAVGGGYMNRPATPGVAAAVLVGLAVALRRPRWRWLVCAHVLVSALYVLAWSVDSALSQTLTGFWYNDAFRLAGLPVITGLPLAALALDAATTAALRLARRRLARRHGARGDGAGGSGAGGSGARRQGARRRGTRRVGRRAAPADARRVWAPLHLAAAAVIALAVVVSARGAAVVVGYDHLADNYANADPVLSDMLDADERALIDRLPGVVPADVAVAGNPWNGSALVWALTGRPTPFPHLVNAFDPARQVVADRLREAAADPSVCPAARELGLGYVLDFGEGYLWNGDRSDRDDRYPGLTALEGQPGFELVDHQGRARLYRITAC